MPRHVRAVRLNSFPPSEEFRAYRGGELRHRDRPLELRLDPAVASDQEHPRLAQQAPLTHPAVVAEPRVVVAEDLDVDETDTARREALPNGLHHVHDGAADAARAELR